jgi:alpha-galactosidase
MDAIIKGKSKSWILLGFLLLLGVTLPASSSGHSAGTTGTPYGNIGRDHPMIIDTATATRFTGSTDSQGFPPSAGWEVASALRFDEDWQGENADVLRETEVRLLWTPETLYLRFQACYRNINVFSEAEPNGRRDLLWERDVVEAFLQPDSSDPRRYKEFEVSPNGFWIDLDIAAGAKHDLQSGLQRRAQIDKKKKLWVAELAIPMKSLVSRFDPAAIWRVNFYRVEGPAEHRFYSAWRPTGTPQPNFHVPEAFGRLVFVDLHSPRSQKTDAQR